MTDKTTPEGFSKRQATEDDVEGHGFRHMTDGIAQPRVDGISQPKVDGEGFSKRQETEDDVEGHGFRHMTDGIAQPRVDAEGFSKRQETEDDDVEGHSILDPFAARELARARERDVQQHAKRHEFERDAREAKKNRS